MPNNIWNGAVARAFWSIPIAVAFTDCVASIIRVDGASMQPCLNPVTSAAPDWVLVEKFSIKLFRKYTRGEVVVLWAPDNPHQQIIKRLIAVEGDTVLEDPASGATAEVPQGRCWVEGDNSAHSGDSKTLYGPVHLGLLEGRVTCVVWPPARMGQVEVVPQPERLIRTDAPHV